MNGGFVLLEWIGDHPPDAEIWMRVRQALETVLDMPTAFRVMPGLPTETLDTRRGQRSSTRILRWLLGHVPPGADKVVGLTDADLFIPVLTFVFGEAQLGGRAAVVSTARLSNRYDGSPAAAATVAARLTKECLHELGHTFGLVHCAAPDCVMARSNAVQDVDRKRAGFCAGCRQRLRNRVAEREDA